MEYLAATLATHGITQSDVAARLGLRPAAISRKLAGTRPWRQREMVEVVAMLRDHGVKTSLDKLFGQPIEPKVAA